MVNGHMHWIPTDDGKGDFYDVGTYPDGRPKLADLPTFERITFTEAVELATIFPPRTAVRRDIF
jgi:hypothetical protein